MENHNKTLFFDGLTPVFFEKTNIALRFHALLILHNFGYRLVRFDALRSFDFTAEGQTRPDIRTRIRSIVTRNRVRHTAIRIRIAVATLNHTAK